MNEVYLATARLLAQAAALLFVDDTFALKGGSAINLFVRAMPRLSVDLDLAIPRFLLSLVAATPQWNLLDIPHRQELPAIQWKLRNLEQLRQRNPGKFAEQAEVLAGRLAAL